MTSLFLTTLTMYAYLILALAPMSHAFTVPSPTLRSPSASSAFALDAKKRRKRNSQSSDNKINQVPSVSNFPTGDDELPDFEIKPEDMDSSNLPKKEAKASPTKPSAISSDPDQVTDAMMGNPNKSTRSVSELIADRALEAKFEFDSAAEDASIPDLADLYRQQTSSAEVPLGKKKARQLARQLARQQAAQAKTAAEEEESFLKKIPFIVDDKGEVVPIKVLEAGTWLGIGLLVLWEVYINSPFFERAAPMAPVVYNLYL